MRALACAEGGASALRANERATMVHADDDDRGAMARSRPVAGGGAAAAGVVVRDHRRVGARRMSEDGWGRIAAG